jgi:hypothetical protein
VKNFGIGPAINLISFSNGNHDWDIPAKANSLMSGEELVLDWTLTTKKLLAQYQGIDDVSLQSCCVPHSTQLITDEDNSSNWTLPFTNPGKKFILD